MKGTIEWNRSTIEWKKGTNGMKVRSNGRKVRSNGMQVVQNAPPYKTTKTVSRPIEYPIIHQKHNLRSRVQKHDIFENMAGER